MRLICLWLSLSLLVWSQESPFKIKVEAEKSKFELGQTVKLIYTIEGPAQAVLNFREADKLELKPFEVKDATSFALPASGERKTWEYRLKVTSYETGNLQLPESKLTCKAEPGAVEQDLVLPGLRFSVERVSPRPGDKPDQIRDLKGLVVKGVPWFVWLAGAVLALLLGLSGWALLKWLRRPRPQVQAPSLPPYPWAQQELTRLASLRHDPEAFYQALSYCLRFYLGWRFSLPLLELTTSETLRVLSLPDQPYRNTKEILEAADLVKFAKLPPASSKLDEHLDWARQLVESNAPEEGKP
jgi:hypothetical protein